MTFGNLGENYEFAAEICHIVAKSDEKPYRFYLLQCYSLRQ
jgi:hypothetical protein